jgi:endonuclease/exonuclease/phosphatase family metal-dependent hydrolase
MTNRDPWATPRNLRPPVRHFAAVAAIVLACGTALAQWSPATGQWGKSDAADLRIMTWNIQDDICSTNAKVEGANDWCAAARIVAAMRPDVLILQECGDNSGEGTGTTVDTVAQLTSAIGMFFHGGADTFHSGSAITSWVQKYAPGYDLPHVFVSSITDGYNRNVILSRFAFGDLNGDGVATYSDISVQADAYAPGGNGGIRGFATAEILLPRATYAGDLVMGCVHLKSGTTSTDLADRLTASQNISYYIDRLFNGAGTSMPDPSHHITLNPRPTSILGTHTPFICGGDFNESFAAEGRYGPAQWIAQGPALGGTDGNDRDRSDSTYDDARDLFTNRDLTQASGYKDDYLVWQDSIAEVRRIWVFNTATIPAGGMPPELAGFSGGGAGATTGASDHRPVVADFTLPRSAPGAFSLQSPASGAQAVSTTPALSWSASAGASSYTVTISPSGGATTTITTSATSAVVPTGVLQGCESVAWGVTATNSGGTTPSAPASQPFVTAGSSDFNGDGDAGTDADIEAFFACLAGNCCATCGSADFNHDGDIGTDADIESFFRVLGGGSC